MLLGGLIILLLTPYGYSEHKCGLNGAVKKQQLVKLLDCAEEGQLCKVDTNEVLIRNFNFTPDINVNNSEFGGYFNFLNQNKGQLSLNVTICNDTEITKSFCKIKQLCYAKLDVVLGDAPCTDENFCGEGNYMMELENY